MVSSNMTGMNAGRLIAGLPEMRNGYPVTQTPAHVVRLHELVKACKMNAAMVPVAPAKNTKIGSQVRWIPIAPSRPCTANGVWQSHRL